MQSHTGRNSKRNSALPGVALLWAALVLAAFGSSQAAAAPFAYVANFDSNTVSVIDTATNKVVGKPITVGTGPLRVAVTPDGTHVYVTNVLSAKVSVVDTASNKVVDTIPVGPNPTGVAVSPDGTRAYVSNVGNGTVSPVLRNGAFDGFAVSPDGTRVYGVSEEDSNVVVIATANNAVVKTIPVGIRPEGVAVTPDGTHAYVTNFGANTVSVIATATNKVVGNGIPVGVNPVTVAVGFRRLPGPKPDLRSNRRN
jgi:YVTN family beta-propeller protein